MKIGMPLNYAGGFKETVEELRAFEDAGLDIVMMPEAYSFDAVSRSHPLGLPPDAGALLGFRASVLVHEDRIRVRTGRLFIPG